MWNRIFATSSLVLAGATGTLNFNSNFSFAFLSYFQILISPLGKTKKDEGSHFLFLFEVEHNLGNKTVHHLDYHIPPPSNEKSSRLQLLY